jgi:type I restriction enzyme R subunit
MSESEIVTRKRRIDKSLRESGWQIVSHAKSSTVALTHHAVEEHPTANGPADYALFVNDQLLGLVEAKKLAVGAQNVLEQAKRYAKGVQNAPHNWGEYKVPFLYATNGENIFFLDVREVKNVSRQIACFHSPAALLEKMGRNDQLAHQWLQQNVTYNPRLRPYQIEAIGAIEKNLIDGRYKMMAAMATGTGKTFTVVNSVYRLLKSKKARRVLFLVDRRSLAAQAVQAFASFETPAGNKFNQEYELYSQSFRRSETDDDTFNPQVLPNDYLTAPDATKTFLYVCTIQRMAINLYGKSAVFEDEEDAGEEDADKLPIPIHAFDVIIADECHRGYTSGETNVWRNVLNHFDAVKIGLTATPAAHTLAFFGEPVYKYSVTQAIKEGYLVDYEPVIIRSNVLMQGAFLHEGEQVGVVDTETGHETIDQLEDERSFETTEIERKITAPDTNRKIIQEIAKYALDFEKQYGRFPKTLIFAANDIDHVSHADRVVELCKEVFNRGDDFVKKITGSRNVDRPLQRIREFRNRPETRIVVTVDMLSTGVDIPALEYIVFLRPVKSRILWEQMLGRGTRRCDDINKQFFTVFDCFGGTLLEYFRGASNFKIDPPKANAVTIDELIHNIYQNTDRDYNVKRLVKRLGHIAQTMNGEARDAFAKFIPHGDMEGFAAALPGKIKAAFTETMQLLRNKDFRDLLHNYPRAKDSFWVGYEVQDEVTSQPVFEANGVYYRPQDYLDAFTAFARTHSSQVEALKILLERPQEWNPQVLNELRQWLAQNNFPEKELQKAHRLVYHKQLADIISMVKHAIRQEEAVLEASERVNKAIDRVFAGRTLNPEQAQWVEYLRGHLVQNLTIESADLQYLPVFEQRGGLARFRKVFGEASSEIIGQLNAEIAA